MSSRRKGNTLVGNVQNSRHRQPFLLHELLRGSRQRQQQIPRNTLRCDPIPRKSSRPSKGNRRQSSSSSSSSLFVFLNRRAPQSIDSTWIKMDSQVQERCRNHDIVPWRTKRSNPMPHHIDTNRSKGCSKGWVTRSNGECRHLGRPLSAWHHTTMVALMSSSSSSNPK